MTTVMNNGSINNDHGIIAYHIKGIGHRNYRYEMPTQYSDLRAGVCRPCDTKELTATSCNFSLCRRVEKVCVDRQLLRYS